MLYTAPLRLEEIDKIRIDDLHLLLSAEKGGEPDVADRRLALHEARTELGLRHPPGQREALMRGPPELPRKTIARDIQPVRFREVVADPALIQDMRRLASFYAVVDRSER